LPVVCAISWAKTPAKRLDQPIHAGVAADAIFLANLDVGFPARLQLLALAYEAELGLRGRRRCQCQNRGSQQEPRRTCSDHFV
jgi:hypothetical protein